MIASALVGTNKQDEPWRAFTTNDYAKFDFEGLPPDNGSVAPIASEDDELSSTFAEWMGKISDQLQTWPPGKVADPVQRVRNLLYVAGAVDEARHPLERHVPAVVLGRLRQDFKDAELAQILAWIAKHPDQGDDSAMDQLDPLELQIGKPDVSETRQRTYYYSLKFLRRLLDQAK